MFSETRTGRVGDAHELALAVDPVDLPEDRRPNLAVGQIVGRRGLPLDAHDGAYAALDRRPVASEQDRRRRAVAWDVGARRVDHVGKIERGYHLLDQLLAELALH